MNKFVKVYVQKAGTRTANKEIFKGELPHIGYFSWSKRTYSQEESETVSLGVINDLGERLTLEIPVDIAKRFATFILNFNKTHVT